MVKNKKEKAGKEAGEGIEGVVYKVQDLKVVIAIGKGNRAGGSTGEKGDVTPSSNAGGSDDFELPERVRM